MNMHPNSQNFEIRSLVAVFGGSADVDGEKATKVLVAEVILVGEKDLLVKEVRSNKVFGSSIFKVPQSICIPISVNPERVVKDRILTPQLDDLVVSVTSERFKDDPPTVETGILYKIFYNKGRPTKCLLLVNNEFQDAVFENLMVLQRNSKK